MIACTSLTIGETPPPPGVDTYYDCVNGECIKVPGGTYKNDPLCAGKCEAPKDNTMTYIMIAAGILGAALLFGGNKR